MRLSAGSVGRSVAHEQQLCGSILYYTPATAVGTSGKGAWASVPVLEGQSDPLAGSLPESRSASSSVLRRVPAVRPTRAWWGRRCTRVGGAGVGGGPRAGHALPQCCVPRHRAPRPRVHAMADARPASCTHSSGPMQRSCMAAADPGPLAGRSLDGWAGCTRAAGPPRFGDADGRVGARLAIWQPSNQSLGT